MDPRPLTPVLECVVMNDGEPDIAVWGYQNPNDFVVTVPIGAENGFSGGASQDLGQPETFEKVGVIGLFQTPFDAGDSHARLDADREHGDGVQRLAPLHGDGRAEEGRRAVRRPRRLQPPDQRESSRDRG